MTPRTLPPPGIYGLDGPDGLEVRLYRTDRGAGSQALAVLRHGQLERVVDLDRLPEVEAPSAHPYRSPAVEVERLVVVPEGAPGPVLAKLVAQGWRVVGRLGSGWVVERG